MNPPSPRKQRNHRAASVAIGVLYASCCLLFFLTAPAAGQEGAKPQATTNKAAAEAGDRFFESKIRPLLVDRCYDCHGPDSDEGEGELRVDSLAGLLQGGTSGPALVRGEPDRSLIILAIRHDGAVRDAAEDEAPPSGNRRACRLGEDGSALARCGALRCANASDGSPRTMGQSGSQLLGFPAAAPAAAGRRERCKLAGRRDRSLHPGTAGSARLASRAAGRQADIAAQGELRSAGPAAIAGRAGRLRRRPVARGVRTRRRPLARFAALRRALGTALA